MRWVFFPICGAISVALSQVTVSGQTLTPQAIHFDGAPGYSDAELKDAAGLKEGQSYSSDDLNKHAQLLMDTGLFAKVGYKFDGTALDYSLAFNTQVFPVLLTNLPLEAGPNLEAQLRQQVPLYHGKVPAEGSLLEGVRSAFQRMLTEQGLHVRVTSNPVGDPATNSVSGIAFGIDSPPVVVGPIRFFGVSAGMNSKVDQVERMAGSRFDAGRSAASLQAEVESIYAGDGFAAARVKVKQQSKPVDTEEAIRVPFDVVVEEGTAYKLGSVQFAADVPVSQTEIEAAAGPRSKFSPDTAYVQSLTALVDTALKSKGYLDCTVSAQAIPDDKAGAANYTIHANPGPVYHLGFVKFEGISDDVHTLLMKNWQMLPGDPYDEAYPSNFMLKAQHGDPQLRNALAGLKASYDVHTDPVDHIVNLSIRLEKQ